MKWKLAVATLALVVIGSIGYVFNANAFADNDADSADTYTVKFFRSSSVSGDSMDRFSNTLNAWLADPNNRVRDASIMFSYNYTDSVLVSVAYKRGPVERPYQVKFFVANTQSDKALERLADGRKDDNGVTDNSGMNDFMADKNVECRYFSQNTVGEKVLMAVVYQAKKN